MIRRTALAIALLAVAAAPAAAAGIRVELDPSATTVAFELKATMHTVYGTASLERGAFTFDLATGAASGEAIVAAASADTENAKRDKKMHAEVLLSAAHPRIVLRAERLEGALAPSGTSEVVLVGSIELLGTAHPVRVPMTVTIEGDTATVDAVFSVPFVEWGLDDPSTFVFRVAKEAPVTVRAEGASVETVLPPENPLGGSDPQ
jgi:polyisoprenoid-binding protein YceI